MTPNELGRLAFETYLKWMKGREKPLEDPDAWDKLAGNIQQAWTVAAMCVADKRDEQAGAQLRSAWEGLESHGPIACSECGGFGTGPDKIDGPGEVYQEKCSRCDGTGVEPPQTSESVGRGPDTLSTSRRAEAPKSAAFFDVESLLDEGD